MRVFPLSNWTEMDVWQYIQREELEVPNADPDMAFCMPELALLGPGTTPGVPPDRGGVICGAGANGSMSDA